MVNTQNKIPKVTRSIPLDQPIPKRLRGLLLQNHITGNNGRMSYSTETHRRNIRNPNKAITAFS